MARRPLACVLGEIELIRPLGMAGIDCAVVARPGDPGRYSRFTTKVVDWIDPWSRPEELVEELLRFGRGEPEKPVIFYDGDWDVLLISRYRHRLRESFTFTVADSTLVEDLLDKARFQALAERLDLPIPRGRLLSPARDAQPPDLELRFPLVLKPLTRQHETWRPLADAKAVHAADAEKLRELWPRLAEAEVDVLAQELVPGEEALIESYHVYVDEGGELVADFTGKKIRTYPPAYGYSTALVTTEERDVRELGRELVEKLGLRGVAKFDFKRDDGKLRLLEVNPRFSLWHHLGAKAGLNLPQLVYSDLAGLPRPPIGRARPGVRWCSVWRDFKAARADGVPFLPWLRFAAGSEAKAVLALSDPLPFVRGALWRMRNGR